MEVPSRGRVVIHRFRSRPRRLLVAGPCGRQPGMRRRRLISMRWLAAALTGIALVAACGGPQHEPVAASSPAHGSSHPPPLAPAAAPCHVARLTVSGGRQAGGALGVAHVDIVITNTGRRCRLLGAPEGITVLRARGHALALDLRRTQAANDRPVVLARRGRVYVALAWNNWCRPNPGELVVRLRLPGTSHALTGPFNGPPDYNFVPACLDRSQPSTLAVTGPYTNRL